MGLCFARRGRTAGDEPAASITWREYVAALSEALDPAGGWPPGGRARVGGLPPRGGEAHGLGLDEAAARRLETALRRLRGHARRAVGLTDVLRLQCEAARVRLLLMQVYVRLGDADRAGALARETQAVL